MHCVLLEKWTWVASSIHEAEPVLNCSMMPGHTEDSPEESLTGENCQHGPAEERAKEDIWPLVKLVFSFDSHSRVCKSLGFAKV